MPRGRRTRKQEREKKRRRRARFREAGLTCDGRPVADPVLQVAGWARHGTCPPGCECRDCLFPPEPFRPHEYKTPHVRGLED